MDCAIRQVFGTTPTDSAIATALARNSTFWDGKLSFARVTGDATVPEYRRRMVGACAEACADLVATTTRLIHDTYTETMEALRHEAQSEACALKALTDRHPLVACDRFFGVVQPQAVRSAGVLCDALLKSAGGSSELPFCIALAALAGIGDATRAHSAGRRSLDVVRRLLLCDTLLAWGVQLDSPSRASSSVHSQLEAIIMSMGALTRPPMCPVTGALALKLLLRIAPRVDKQTVARMELFRVAFELSPIAADQLVALGTNHDVGGREVNWNFHRGCHVFGVSHQCLAIAATHLVADSGATLDADEGVVVTTPHVLSVLAKYADKGALPWTRDVQEHRGALHIIARHTDASMQLFRAFKAHASNPGVGPTRDQDWGRILETVWDFNQFPYTAVEAELHQYRGTLVVTVMACDTNGIGLEEYTPLCVEFSNTAPGFCHPANLHHAQHGGDVIEWLCDATTFHVLTDAQSICQFALGTMWLPVVVHPTKPHCAMKTCLARQYACWTNNGRITGRIDGLLVRIAAEVARVLQLGWAIADSEASTRFDDAARARTAVGSERIWHAMNGVWQRILEAAATNADHAPTLRSATGLLSRKQLGDITADARVPLQPGLLASLVREARSTAPLPVATMVCGFRKHLVACGDIDWPPPPAATPAPDGDETKQDPDDPLFSHEVLPDVWRPDSTRVLDATLAESTRLLRKRDRIADLFDAHTKKRRFAGGAQGPCDLWLA